MDSLRKKNVGRMELGPMKNAVDFPNARNSSRTTEDRWLAPVDKYKNPEGQDAEYHGHNPVVRDSFPRQDVQNAKPEKKVEDDDEVRIREGVEEKPARKINSWISISLFLMVAVFVALIGWYEFKNNDNTLEKLLSKKTTETKKSASLEAQASAANSSAAAAQTAQAQQAATAAQRNQTVPEDVENINTGATSPDTASNNESGEKKTFKNAEVSFDYPPEYKIEDSGGQISAVKTDTMWRMKIYDNKDKKEIQEWFDAYFSGKDIADCSESNPETLKVGSYTTKFMKADSGKCEGEGYYALNSEKTKVARVRLDKADEAEANKILGSFKFIK